MNTGGGPTDDKPAVTLTAPDPNTTSSFLNIRVANIQEIYEDWSAKVAQFLTPPVDHGVELRCYLRDPDWHLIEVGQANRDFLKERGLLKKREPRYSARPRSPQNRKDQAEMPQTVVVLGASRPLAAPARPSKQQPRRRNWRAIRLSLPDTRCHEAVTASMPVRLRKRVWTRASRRPLLVATGRAGRPTRRRRERAEAPHRQRPGGGPLLGARAGGVGEHAHDEQASERVGEGRRGLARVLVEAGDRA